MPQKHELLVIDTGMFGGIRITAHFNGTYRSWPQSAPRSVASALSEEAPHPAVRGIYYLLKRPKSITFSLWDHIEFQQLEGNG